MRKFLAILLLAVAVGAASGATVAWEAVDAPAHARMAVPLDAQRNPDKVEVVAGDGYIYVASSRPVAVKVFTILGQLVSSESLPAGQHRLRIATKGIYIVKIGTATHRVIL